MSSTTWSSAIRRWLLPSLLVALVAAVLLMPYNPDCDSLSRDSDPAVARVGSECVRHSDYSERLRIIDAGMEHAVEQFLSETPGQEYLRIWYDRVRFYGSETIALAEAIRDAVLYQQAEASGHIPSEEEVAAARDNDRLRAETSSDYIRLVKLAYDGDEAGFREVLERSKHPDLMRIRQDSDPAQMMASLADIDWRPLEQSLKEGEELLQSIGVERYWQEIVPSKLRRDMAIDLLQAAALEASLDGPRADIPRLAWLDYQQQALADADIALTDAVPAYIFVHNTLAYLSDLLEAERNALEEEFRLFQQRPDQRQP